MTERVSDPAAPALITALEELKHSVNERLDAVIAAVRGEHAAMKDSVEKFSAGLPKTIVATAEDAKRRNLL